MIQRPGAESAVELLGSKPAEVVNGEGPQVEDIVSGEALPLLQHHHLSPQQGQFDGRSQPTWPRTQHKTLRERGREICICTVDLLPNKEQGIEVKVPRGQCGHD